ncbi:MAG: GGDEF domain-containing protein [Calditrichales bacterium]|nr:MAG: GGDEF domain-containing protein [Calditrichales bacterium]
MDAISTRLEKHRQITRRYKAEIEQTRHRLEISKTYDDVTGLPKRTVLKKILTSDIAEDSHNTLFIIKLNRYKRVADIFDKDDHQTLSRELIRRIDKSVRRKKEIFFLDEGEFGILFRDFPAKKVTSKMTKNVLSRIRKPITVNSNELNFTACVGIAMTDSENGRPVDMITNAELALNAAEENGFNTFSIYREAFKKNIIDRINLESGLHKALERNELTIFYQPKIDSKSRRIIGLEALIRWQNANYGLLSPTQFIPMAEENGLIIPIGEWLLESVCHQINRWKNAGFTPPPVAVNISALQIEQKNFVNMLASTLKKNRITNDLLELELTESILISNSAQTSKKLAKLRDSGIKVAIDDFGTGYSSLSYLTNFPFDKIKIDQSFIRDISTDKAAAALATSIISMAHKLGVSVIAEGVETEAQLQLLEENNCDEIQGFYFGRPVPAEEIEPLLESVNFKGRS